MQSMKKRLEFLCGLTAVLMSHLLVLSTALAADVGDASKPATAGRPIWEAGAIQNEPLLFIQEEGQATATAKLLFTPSLGFRITHPDLSMKYHQDRDYILSPESKLVTLTVSSRIPFKTHAQMFPPKGSPNMFSDVLHSEGHFFHDLQVQASYRTSEKWDGPVPGAETEKLKITIAKLKAKQPFSIVALGDSITEGYNASGFRSLNTPPFQPPFPRLVGNTLQERFGSKVSVVNLGQSGSVSSAGFNLLDKVEAEKPDLVIVAYGMNHGEGPEEYGKKIRKLLDAVQTGNSNADVVLVASMCGNPRMFPAKRFAGYCDHLKKLEGPGVAVADVTAIWAELMKKKRFSALSGNNVNHPNDFSHRVYAQVIARLFGQ
ncbi:MAG: acyl-CoA thioesterase-1 [Pseudoalteromonas tetraodonis]|jgi:acyl-CoA thioesterase-1